MTGNDKIFERVIQVLKQLSSALETSEIDSDMSLINDLSIDSIKVAELSILLENEFGYPMFIPDLLSEYRDPYEITVAALVRFVHDQLANQ